MVANDEMPWVEFIYPHGFRRSVMIHGEWNSFQPMPMQREETPKRVFASAVLHIPPGEYRYFFVVDGKRVVSKKHPRREYDNGSFNTKRVKNRQSVERDCIAALEARLKSEKSLKDIGTGPRAKHESMTNIRKHKSLANMSLGNMEPIAKDGAKILEQESKKRQSKSFAKKSFANLSNLIKRRPDEAPRDAKRNTTQQKTASHRRPVPI